MSMKNHGGSGHVVNVTELTKLLPTSIYRKWLYAIDGSDIEKLENLLVDYLPKKYPQPDSVFVMDDEMESDELVSGELYAYFCEQDLLKSIKTKEALKLEEAGIIPTYSRWVTWG